MEIDEITRSDGKTEYEVSIEERRLEDVAYGAGVWAGAVRARSTRALRPVAPPRF